MGLSPSARDFVWLPAGRNPTVVLSSTVKLPATLLDLAEDHYHSADLPPGCVFVTSPSSLPTYSVLSEQPYLNTGLPRAHRMMLRPIMSTGGVPSCQSLNVPTTAMPVHMRQAADLFPFSSSVARLAHHPALCLPMLPCPAAPHTFGDGRAVSGDLVSPSLPPINAQGTYDRH